MHAQTVYLLCRCMKPYNGLTVTNDILHKMNYPPDIFSVPDIMQYIVTFNIVSIFKDLLTIYQL